LAREGSTVVKNSTQNPEITGSNLTAATGKEKLLPILTKEFEIAKVIKLFINFLISIKEIF